jgi:prepilin-type N-terminal cleavage/methylation domain-containing protein
MKNENGMTLIELLAAVAIIGIVIVPTLMLITGTFTRTVVQGKESQINYYAQEVIEEARVSSYPGGLNRVYGTCTEAAGCSAIDLLKNDLTLVDRANKDAVYTITFKSLDPAITNTNLRNKFYEIKVLIETNETPGKRVELTTVVKKR